MAMAIFEPKEVEEFIRFLKKVAENGYYFPDEVSMRAVHATVSMWAPELVIFRYLGSEKEGVTGKEILLALYEGGVSQFQGKWHIPGGYNRWDELDIQTTCSRLAKREIGIDVSYIKTIDIYKWRPEEHPYGRPLSIYVQCVPRGQVMENEKLRFFGKRNVPENIVEPHRRFIEKRL